MGIGVAPRLRRLLRLLSIGRGHLILIAMLDILHLIKHTILSSTLTGAAITRQSI